MEEKEPLLTRTELATVKRINKSVSTFRRKREKAIEIIKAKQAEIEEYNNIIDSFEAPIILMTNGYNSEQVLDGTMDREHLLKLDGTLKEETVDSTEEIPEVAIESEEEVVTKEQSASFMPLED